MWNKKIRVLMLEKNMSVKELSEKTGIPNSTLALHLKTRDILERPRKIAKVLGVNLKDLV